MKPKIIILLTFSSGWLLLNSCTPWKYVPKDNTTDYFNLKGKPEQVLWYKYQQGGELFTKTTFLFNKKGQLTKKESEIHNPQTKVKHSTSQWIYDENGFLDTALKANQKRIFVNDRWGREKKMYFYKHPDSLPQLTKTNYKPRKRTKISKGYLGDGTFYSLGISKYNKQNNMIYSRFLIPDYNADEETWWDRDERQNIVFSKQVNNEQNDTTYIYSDYDRYGNTIKERYLGGTGKMRVQTYNYQYDAFGNWIERTIEEDGYVRKERREIVYFEDEK